MWLIGLLFKNSCSLGGLFCWQSRKEWSIQFTTNFTQSLVSWYIFVSTIFNFLKKKGHSIWILILAMWFWKFFLITRTLYSSIFKYVFNLMYRSNFKLELSVMDVRWDFIKDLCIIICFHAKKQKQTKNQFFLKKVLFRLLLCL